MLQQPGAPPLYAQIAADLRARIVAGKLKPGSQLPSEHELAAEFGVGRPTLRQATELLVRHGLLSRRRGAGTFVEEPAPEVDLFSSGGTLSSFARSGLALESALLGEVRPRRVPEDADNPFRGRTAYFVARRSTLGGEPVLLEEMYLDPAFFPDLDRHATDGRSLSRLCSEHYRLRPTAQEQRFTVQPLDARRARLLRLPEGAAILAVRRSVDLAGAPGAVFAELFCRTDRLSFVQRIDLDAAAQRPPPIPTTAHRRRGRP